MQRYENICKYKKKVTEHLGKTPAKAPQPGGIPGHGNDPSGATTLQVVAKRYQGRSKAGGRRKQGKTENKADPGRARRAVPTGGDRTRPGTTPPGGGKGHTDKKRKPPPKREQPRRPPDTQAPKDRDQPAKRPQVFISPAPAGGGGQKGRGQRGNRLGWERRR